MVQMTQDKNSILYVFVKNSFEDTFILYIIPKRKPYYSLPQQSGINISINTEMEQMWADESLNILSEPLNLTNLNDYCKMKIFENLGCLDLLNTADTSKQLQPSVCDVFKREYKKKDSICSPFARKYYHKKDLFLFTIYLFILKFFAVILSMMMKMEGQWIIGNMMIG